MALVKKQDKSVSARDIGAIRGLFRLGFGASELGALLSPLLRSSHNCHYNCAGRY